MKNTIPDLFAEKDPGNEKMDTKFLTGIRFALIGDFTAKKSELTKKLVKYGGDKKTTISKESNVVVMGTHPKEKDIEKLDILKHDGFDIPRITEKDLIDILEKRNISFSFPKVTKKVIIDYDFIFDPKYRCLKKISKDGITHCLGNREIFVYRNDAKIHFLWQIIGNLAGSARPTFDPYDTDYIMLDKLTIEQLRNGVKDDLILLIEDTYNKSKSEKFNYKFIREAEFMDFAKDRSERVHDNITLDLINKYESN